MAYDAIVIGAGLPGLLAAWRLAEGGFATAVAERRWTASGSSSLAAGHVPQDSTSPANLAILRRTKAVVEDLEHRTGGMVRFAPVGGIGLSTSPDGVRLFRERAALAARLGVAGECLEPGEVAARWPELNAEGLTAGYYTAGDGLVRSQSLAAALAAAAAQAGAEIWEGCPVESVRIEGDRVTGVAIGGEKIAARRALVAAGAWSAPLLAASGLRLPVRTFTLTAAFLAGAPTDLPFLSEMEAGFYALRRSPRTLLLGLPPADLDADPENFSADPDPAEANRFLGMLRRRVPALRSATIAGGWTGILTATPDAWPLLGRFGPDGLFLATGFGGGGLQRMAAAEAVAQLMLGREPFYDLSSGEALRFNGYQGEPFSFREGPFYYGETGAAQLW